MVGIFLTEDTLIYIFTFLPLTSIYKFRSVSKVWSSILSNPYFITKWFQLNNTNKSLPWIHYHTTIYFKHKVGTLRLKNYACPSLHSQFISRHDHGFSFRFLNSEPFQGRDLNFVGSSNGLVLCYKMDISTLHRVRMYYVCNPLTQKWVPIPSPPNPMLCNFGVIGFFSEYTSSYTTSCYKIVRITSSASVKLYAHIFCSNLGEWKTFKVSCPLDVSIWDPSYENNVVANDGVLYWINEGIQIIAYNLDNNSCSFICFPDEYADRRDRILGVSEGLICYARITRNQRKLSVWVLKGDKWKLSYNSIDLHDIFVEMDLRKQRTRYPSCSAERVQLVGFNPVDCHVVLLSCWDYIWGFNIQNRRFEELSYPSLFLANSNLDDFPLMRTPFVLKPMPTIIPPPSWIDT